jgi:hypothetical protein
MGQVTHEQVNLMLRLYELRREARLRQARAWFLNHFHPVSPEEIGEKYPPGSEENANIRMTISYWDMVAGIVNRGLIDDGIFFENNGEIWVVWDRIRNIAPAWRTAFQNPTIFGNLEETCRRMEAWREKRAPGSTAAMRKILEMARATARTSAH